MAMNAGGINLWLATDQLGRAVHGESWTGSEHFARGEASRIAAFEQTEREIKYMQQAHGHTRDFIMGMSLGEWQRAVATAAAGLERPETVDFPTLTEAEKLAVLAVATDDYHPYEAAGYARLTGVVALLRRWLKEGSISARALRPDGTSMALPPETWTPALASPSVFQRGALALPLLGECPVSVDRLQFELAMRTEIIGQS